MALLEIHWGKGMVIDLPKIGHANERDIICFEKPVTERKWVFYPINGFKILRTRLWQTEVNDKRIRHYWINALNSLRHLYD